MKKYFVYMIALFLACQQEKKDGLTITVHVGDELQNYKDQKKGTLHFNVNIDFSNNSDSILEYVTMSCTWQDNVGFNDERIFLPIDSLCINNFPDLIKLNPGQVKKYNGIIWVDSSAISDSKDYALGFILIERNEVSFEKIYQNVLREKIKNKNDILWSKPFKFKNKE